MQVSRISRRALRKLLDSVRGLRARLTEKRRRVANGYVCGRPVGEVGAPDPSPETGAPSGRRPDPLGGPPGTDAAPELVWASPRRIRNAIAIPTPMKAAMITGNSSADVPKASPMTSSTTKTAPRVIVCQVPHTRAGLPGGSSLNRLARPVRLPAAVLRGAADHLADARPATPRSSPDQGAGSGIPRPRGGPRAARAWRRCWCSGVASRAPHGRARSRAAAPRAPCRPNPVGPLRSHEFRTGVGARAA